MEESLKMDEPTFMWLGTAGFRIEFCGLVILIDPWLSRPPRAHPTQDLGPGDMADADFIFISHGHFDHLADVPAIAALSDARVYCSDVAAKTLARKGVPPAKIKALQCGDSLDLGAFSVDIETCRHIVFDHRLLLRTAPGVLREARGLLPQVTGMPSGPVLVYSFTFGDLKTTQLGSLGLKPADLPGKKLPRADILFLPLQGHTDICILAAELTAAMAPRAIVPEHHDDFFPPVSRTVELAPFEHMVKRLLPECAYYEPRVNRKFTAEDVFAGF